LVLRSVQVFNQFAIDKKVVGVFYCVFVRTSTLQMNDLSSSFPCRPYRHVNVSAFA
jgi:hypothetical protein